MGRPKGRYRGPMNARIPTPSQIRAKETAARLAAAREAEAREPDAQEPPARVETLFVDYVRLLGGPTPPGNTAEINAQNEADGMKGRHRAGNYDLLPSVAVDPTLRISNKKGRRPKQPRVVPLGFEAKSPYPPGLEPKLLQENPDVGQRSILSIPNTKPSFPGPEEE